MVNREIGVVILGSTGSIGESTLAVIRENPGRFQVHGLSCESNLEAMVSQILEFSPQAVSVGCGKGEQLRKLLPPGKQDIEILEGLSGNKYLARFPQASVIVAAIVGAAGVEPVMAGIQAKKTIALANKESIVLAGSLLMAEAKKQGVKILPVDSEHNAIFQSLMGNRKEDLAHITLTASGGPFRNTPAEDFSKIEVQDALNHPNWNMGRKITIDSATMMNKCLEIIEAKWLFDLEPTQIKVLVHPQSIIHSMVTYKDGSTISQMGVPDMKTPIANCLGYPERIFSGSDALDLAAVGQLSFEAPDLQRFPTLQMAYDVLEIGEGAPAALNGANEVLVDLFLAEKISFLDIFQSLRRLVEELYVLKEKKDIIEIKTISDAIQADQWGREFVTNLFSK